ncbi:MAG TPA: hypothetical protein VMI31_19275 [Fimbriimonadaceae bacterium]|nr:hypothetical protein [Fimbriimonadaceae bacterium]
MKRITMVATTLAAALCGVVANPSIAAAQEPPLPVYVTARSVGDTIQEAFHESKRFRASYERRFDHAWHANWRRSDDQRTAIQKMDEALERVHTRLVNGEKPEYLRDDVRTTIERARVVNALDRDPYDVLAGMSDQWRDLRRSLDDLATAYDLQPV